MEMIFKVGIIGGGMFYHEVLGPTFRDFHRDSFIGSLGQIGMSRFAPELANVNLKVVAMATRTPESVAKNAEEFYAWTGDTVATYSGETPWIAMIDKHNLDFLVVATPDSMHAAPIHYALNHGVD